VSRELVANPPASEKLVKETFRDLWTRSDPRSKTRLDPLSEDITEVLLALLPKPDGIRVLEAGSGTGRVSALLAERGYEVTLLDISREALEISREVFRIRHCRFQAIQGSIFALPVPDGFFDVIWNAGVIEHFHFDEQVEALRELARALKPQGLLVTLNPSARGRVYRAGKVIAELRGKWAVGQEFPVRTLQKHCLKLGFSLVHEEDVLPEHQFRFFGRYGDPFFAAGRQSQPIRLAYLKMFGGYLRLSVVRKG
jgi:SAM-dependent methyltransferase